MKNLFKILAAVFIGIFMISCEKDEDKAVLEMTKTPTLSADATTLVMLKANENDKAVKFTWTNPTFNLAVVNNNALEIAKAGTGFKDAKSTDLIASDLTATYTVKDFNKIIIDAGFLPEIAENIEIRMKASVGNAVFYSNVISMKVTPYLTTYPSFYLVGEASAIGWDASKAQLLYKNENISTIYTYLESSKTFRFLGQKDWNPLNYSLDFAGMKQENKYFKTWSSNLSAAPAENIKFNGATGMYKIVIDAEATKKTITVSASPITVWNPANLYIVGTINSWNAATAIAMTNIGDGKFEHTLALPAGSQFKFLGQQSFGELDWGNLLGDGNTGYLAPKGNNGNIMFNGNGGNYKISVDLKLGIYKIEPL
ncbi:SusE domain-containing protein [Chryseobacterium rhizosphaerae]|uniref:SusE domain-containing protein n=1 Tax=Chryseobacterium rhizosphaerae TaxID=395937 RepID=UPI00235A3C95|nr:SusE domain-containing protein [Chryseobacterium rhizosphaerae]MDC8100860.1 SusE domain-containing protein [Chryseobacterium rhizosphaerae]